MAAAIGRKLNGPALRALRLKDGKTITQCAEEVGVTQGTWSNWEAGRRKASPNHVERITEVLMLDDVRAIIWPNTATAATVAQDGEEDAA